MRQRQPDRADLLPARRDAVEDAPRDDQMPARIVVAEREAEAMIVKRDERAGAARRARRARAASARRRDGIITCLFYGEIRRLDPGARARAGRPGLFLVALPRFVVSLAARDRRPAARLDGHAAQGADAVLRGQRDARVGRRLSRRCTTSAARAARRGSQRRFSAAPHRAGAGRRSSATA